MDAFWILSSRENIMKLKITMHWELQKSEITSSQVFILWTYSISLSQEKWQKLNKKKKKANLWICYRNCFGLLYTALRNTLPRACFLQSILASSLTTAKKRDSEKCAVDDYLLSITHPLCHSVRFLNVPYNSVKLETILELWSTKVEWQPVLFPVWTVSLFEAALLTQFLITLLS